MPAPASKNKEGNGKDMSVIWEKHKEPGLYYSINAKGKKKFQVRYKYYDSTGKRREFKRTFESEKEALKALLEFKAQSLRGNIKQFEHDKITVAQWLDNWFESIQVKLKPTTREHYKNAIDKRLKPSIGHYKLQKLDKTTYQREFINPLAEKFKPRTIKSWHLVFAAAINAAVEEEYLTRNRFRKISIPDKEDDVVKDNFLSEHDLNLLIEHARENENITFYTALLTLAYTGMRKGELMGLHWKNIDFEKRTITVEQTRDNLGLRKPKTKNSYRTIPIDPFVAEQLKRYQSWCKQLLLRYGKKIKADSIVFISESAEPIHNVYINIRLKKIIKKTGVKEITVHGLRHTHATILLNRNMNIKAIAERLGNTPEMIYDVYGHLTKESNTALVDVFSDSLNLNGAEIGANK